MQKAAWAGGVWLVVLGLLLSTSSAWALPPFAQQAELSGSVASDFGYSVAVQGNTAVVGAPNTSGGGAANVFVRSGTTWTQQAMLIGADQNAGDFFGGSVSLNGSTIVVGAYQKATSTGAAYVFVQSGSTWTQQAKLTASDATTGTQFGWSVAVSGGTALIGTTGRAAYVFTQSGTTWTQRQELFASDQTTSDQFGYSVALSGNTAFVGAPNKASRTGAVYVFTNSGTWSQLQKLTASDGAISDAFGISVAFSNTTAWIGAPGRSGNTGAAYVFTLGGSWVQQQTVTGASGDYFGAAIALNSAFAVVGAPDALGGSRGTAYVFAPSGGNWSQQQQISAADGANGDFLGVSAAIDGVTVVLGAYGRSSSTGAAYVLVGPSGPQAVPALGKWAPLLGALMLFAGLGITTRRKRVATS
jgi:hypothetical protein